MSRYRLFLLAVLVLIVSCGTKLSQPTKSSNSPINPQFQLPVSPLQCLVFVTNEAATASSLFNPVSVSIKALEEGNPVPIVVEGMNLDSSVVQTLAPFSLDPADGSQRARFLPLRAGEISGTVQIAKAADPSSQTRCNLKFNSQTPLFSGTGSVMLTATPNSVRHGQSTVLSFSSVGASSCSLYRDGTQLPVGTAIAGSLLTPPLLNPTNLPVTTVFEVRCIIFNQSVPVSSTAAVVIGPISTTVFQFSDGTQTKVARARTDVGYRWQADPVFTYCYLNDGAGPQMIPLSGLGTIANVQVSMTIALVCLNNISGFRDERTLVLTVIDPTVGVTANGQMGSVLKPARTDTLIGWTSRDTLACAFTGPIGITATGTSGSFTVLDADLRAPTAFTVNCTSLVGDVSSTVMVNPTGNWFQVNGADCVANCSNRGLVNAADPFGFRCVSGERISPAVLPGTIYRTISFATYGVWPNPALGPSARGSDGVSVGMYCYGSNQTRDADQTDTTVGCYCR